MPYQRNVVQDVKDLNLEVCRRLWRMVTVGEVPTALAPRLIYPEYSRRNDKNTDEDAESIINIRRSEQEARFAYAEALSSSGIYYYSVETPTQERYSFGHNKGQGEGNHANGQGESSGTSPDQPTTAKGRSASSDMSLYLPGSDGKLEKVVNVELKYGTSRSEPIRKDLEKIVQEHNKKRQLVGNWFHILKAADLETFGTLFSRFKHAFEAVSKKVHVPGHHECNVSFVVCICVLRGKWACIRPFECPNSAADFAKSVIPVFDCTFETDIRLSLKEAGWDVFEDTSG